MEWTLDSFRLAGHAHLHSAERVLNFRPAKGAQPPALTPGSAAYLAHVALECAIKARILCRGNCYDTEDLKKKQPKVFQALFASKQGHDLEMLAAKIRLEEVLKTEGQAWRDDLCWRRMSSPDRPYTLRYGAERIREAEAREDVTRTRDLLGVLCNGIKKMAPQR
jgi:hypothetical protein